MPPSGSFSHRPVSRFQRRTAGKPNRHGTTRRRITPSGARPGACPRALYHQRIPIPRKFRARPSTRRRRRRPGPRRPGKCQAVSNEGPRRLLRRRFRHHLPRGRRPRRPPSIRSLRSKTQTAETTTRGGACSRHRGVPAAREDRVGRQGGRRSCRVAPDGQSAAGNARIGKRGLGE